MILHFFNRSATGPKGSYLPLCPPAHSGPDYINILVIFSCKSNFPYLEKKINNQFIKIVPNMYYFCLFRRKCIGPYNDRPICSGPRVLINGVIINVI